MNFACSWVYQKTFSESNVYHVMRTINKSRYKNVQIDLFVQTLRVNIETQSFTIVLPGMIWNLKKFN